VIRLLAAGAAAVLVALAARPLAAPDAAALHEQGRAIYNFRCYFCHGYSGDAKTVAAGLLAQRPLAFSAAAEGELTPERVLDALRHGRRGTAMAPFRGVLTEQEMVVVARFVVEEFAVRRGTNTRYHTAENGWPNHDRFGSAFRYVTDPSALQIPVDRLTAEEVSGKRLYLSACISCHDSATPGEAAGWDARPVSYPADGHDCVSCHDRIRYAERGLAPLPPPASYHGAAGVAAKAAVAPDDASASPYAAHDVPVQIARASPQQVRGQSLYLKNCAFCHAADGTARHWIGRFLEPHPRDLTDPAFRASVTRDELAQRIADGLPGTAMPTWRNVLQRDEIDAIAAYVEAAFGTLKEERR
jgi:cytochrome c oxidase cbb3-type subunit 3